MAFFVDVITTPRNDPNTIVSERRINYDNSRSRQWLAGHSNWALRTGHAVHTAAANLHGRQIDHGHPNSIEISYKAHAGTPTDWKDI